MTEKDLSQFGLLDEFTIMELEQRLEFEGWYDGNCICGPPNVLCPPPEPIDGGCGPLPDDGCIPGI